MTYTELQTKLQEAATRLGTINYELQMKEDFIDQGMDSLDVIEFFMEVEKDLGISIPDSELVKINTPHQLIELIILRTHMSATPELPTM